MSLAGAAVVPAAPLLVPAVAGGSAGMDEALRAATMKAVAALLSAPGGPVVVVGPAAATGEVHGTWDWSGLGVAERGSGPGPALPLALGIGAWLVEACDPDQACTYLGVDDARAPGECAALGRELAATAGLRLLVVGDGSACRSEKAPGYLDARAEAFDGQAERALAAADAAALLALSPVRARQLLAAGRAPWQVLAGAAQREPYDADLLHAAAPYGVAYLVALWCTRTPAR